jgi:hypothetical protein
MLAVVALYKALGGGWHDESNTNSASLKIRRFERVAATGSEGP